MPFPEGPATVFPHVMCSFFSLLQAWWRWARWPGRPPVWVGPEGTQPSMEGPAHRLCLEKSCLLLRNIHFRFAMSKMWSPNCVKLLRCGCWQKKKRREKKLSNKGKEQRCEMAKNSVWKYNKSQLWIIGFLQLFHNSGVYIRVVSSMVLSRSWITVLILTHRQLWGQANAHVMGVNEPELSSQFSGQLPQSHMLMAQPLSHLESFWEQVEYLPQVWTGYPTIFTSLQYSDISRTPNILRHIWHEI